jgi:hypothetical protein
VLVPLLAVILFMALYPQLALRRSERSVKTSVAAAHGALKAPSASLAAGAPAGAATPSAGGALPQGTSQ